MKNTIIILSFIALLVASGCKDLLDENPKTFISSANFYKSEGDFEAALMGLYVNVRSMSTEKNLREVFADYNDRPESAEQTGDLWKNNPSSNFWPIRDGWGIPYSIINNANMVLEALNNIELPKDKKNKIEAEAKCIRAFAYFSLVRLYGDIPLRVKPVKSLDETKIAKSSQEEVYTLIFSDLTFAEANLPEVATDQGRVYKYVATSLLAQAYLTSAGFPLNKTANYALAKNKALDVINSGKFDLIDDYAKVFHNKIYTKESIWEALFLPPTTGNPLHSMCSPTGNTTAVLLPTTAFANGFPNGDKRRSWGIKDKYVNAKGNTFAKRSYFQKFVDEQFYEDELSPATANSTLGYTSQIIRLAEVYLIAAEAENEVNGPANAYQYINKVRQRARIDKNDPLQVPDLKGLSKEDFRKAVLSERKWELHLEGSAWFDMKRTQTFDKVQEARGASLAVPVGAYNNTWLIPDFEVSNNNIAQNPSYGGK